MSCNKRPGTYMQPIHLAGYMYSPTESFSHHFDGDGGISVESNSCRRLGASAVQLFVQVKRLMLLFHDCLPLENHSFNFLKRDVKSK